MKKYLIILLTASFGHQLLAQIEFPDDAMTNILDYRGSYSVAQFTSGTVDVTDAIQEAIDDVTEARISEEPSAELYESHVIYFPPGTYLLTRPIENDAFKNEPNNGGVLGQGGTARTFNLQGAGVGLTTFKLSDNNPLFQDVNNPLPVLSNIETGVNYPLPASAWGNIAFMASFFNITVDTGDGNPGAIGLQYMANNQGSIRDVEIKGGGQVGLDLDLRIPGPALVKNVTIDDFDIGVKTNTSNYAMVFEDLTIRNSRIGFYNNDLIVTIRKLTTQNISETAIINNGDATAFMTILDSELNGSGVDAISSEAFLYARNITSSGFTNTLNDRHASQILTGTVEEHVSHGTFRTVEGPTKSLSLPIEETPEPDWSTPIDDWVSVLDFGYTPGNQTGLIEAANAAIDFMNEPGNEAKNVLYFPEVHYIINESTGSIKIHGNVKKVMGCFSEISPKKDRSLSADPIFVIEDTDYSLLYIERINIVPEPWKKIHAVFENRSATDLVLRHIYIGHGKAYVNNGASGKLYLEDFSALSQRYYAFLTPPPEIPYPAAVPQFEFGDQTVWARHFDPEQRYEHAVSDGGQVWVLGIKTEKAGTIFKATNGARVEILGGCILPSEPDEDDAMFEMVDSEMSVVVAEHISERQFNDGNYYGTIIEETRNGITLKMSREDFPRRWIHGSAIPLFLGYAGDFPIDPLGVPAKNEELIYPNPTSGKFTFRGDADRFYATYKIFDLSGRSIAKPLDRNKNDFSFKFRLEPGVYSLVYDSTEGKKTQKIIIR